MRRVAATVVMMRGYLVLLRGLLVWGVSCMGLLVVCGYSG